MYGDDWEYARSRLSGTIVRLDDEPVFVQDILPGMEAVIYYLKDISEALSVDAKKLNVVPVPLGMCNARNDAHYLSRIPMRRDWKQGLRKENFTCSTIPVHLIQPEQLRDVIVGKYPSLEECLEKCRDGVAASAAWHRHWAVNSDMLIRYKNEGVVGSVREGELILFDNYRYLQEALQEVA